MFQVSPADEDWLNEPAPAYPVAKPDEGAPADADLPGLPLSSDALDRAVTATEKRAQFIAAWSQLTEHQRIWLNTWRESRFNQGRTIRVLAGTTVVGSKTTVQRWRTDPGFEYVEKVLRTASVEEILSRDYLAARHEDIAETALTPAPILHQGVATGHYEAELGVAAKANETLMKLGGHLKDKELDLSIGIVGPALMIQVVQADNSVKTLQATGVPVQLPEPASDEHPEEGGDIGSHADEEDWLNGA